MRHAILVRLAIAGVAALGAAGAARAQISPGPLARPHAALEGVRNCIRCHGGGSRDEMTVKCLDCHREIGWLRSAGRGLHARVATQSCAACHPDHAGADFALVKWPGGDSSRFDHTRAGWPLSGAHARTACARCHRAGLRVSPAAALAPRPGGHWTDLERTCAACHTDPHRGAPRGACESCHSTDAWHPAPGFDHARTRYPLTGRHRTVACTACHGTLTATAAAFAPVAHTRCADCHRDPHGGRLGASCERCHTTAGFHTFGGASFDHTRTRFPLRGAHARVACDRCHDFRTVAGARRDPPFATCRDCHADAHAGTAAVRNVVPDCSACHDESAFRPATFTAAQHAAAGFTLTGAHATAPCAGCHATDASPAARRTRGSAGVDLHPARNCVACHADPHRGRATGGAAGADCAACHTTAAFRPATVDIAMHARFTFALTGAHAAVPCAACHQEMGRAGAAPARFAEVRSACADCHRDPHGGQFGAAPCDRCHDTRAYRPAPGFDHDRDSPFPLRGGHAGVPCASCHTAPAGARAGTPVRYRGTPTACEACHTPARERRP